MWRGKIEEALELDSRLVIVSENNDFPRRYARQPFTRRVSRKGNDPESSQMPMYLDIARLHVHVIVWTRDDDLFRPFNPWNDNRLRNLSTFVYSFLFRYTRVALMCIYIYICAYVYVCNIDDNGEWWRCLYKIKFYDEYDWKNEI